MSNHTNTADTAPVTVTPDHVTPGHGLHYMCVFRLNDETSWHTTGCTSSVRRDLDSAEILREAIVRAQRATDAWKSQDFVTSISSALVAIDGHTGVVVCSDRLSNSQVRSLPKLWSYAARRAPAAVPAIAKTLEKTVRPLEMHQLPLFAA